MKDSVTIVIVTYNGMQWLPKTLASIPSEYNIVIVDNNSTDSTLAFVKEKYPQITILENEENLGFGQANNIGMAYALERNAEYIFLLNQDAYLEQDCLKHLIAAQRQSPEFGIMSPIHLTGAGDALDSNFAMYIRNEDKGKLLLYNALKGTPGTVSISFVNAAGWLLSRKCVETVGGFDPIFFHYGEDRNYCQRVLFHGFKIGITSAASMRHDRENRKEKEVAPFSSEYYRLFTRTFKVGYGNVNDPNNPEQIQAKLNYYKRQRLKYLLLLKRDAFCDASRKFQLIKKTKDSLLNSMDTNKQKGSTYLKKV